MAQIGHIKKARTLGSEFESSKKKSFYLVPEIMILARKKRDLKSVVHCPFNYYHIKICKSQWHVMFLCMSSEYIHYFDICIMYALQSPNSLVIMQNNLFFPLKFIFLYD